MPRRWSMILIAGLVVLATPEQPAAQQFERAFMGGPRTPTLGRVWSGLDFGARIVRPARPARQAPTGRGRSMFDAPSQEGSPWRHVPVTKSQRGDLVHAPMIEVHTFAAPIDCAMAKPGDPTLDPKIIQPVPTHRAHSGVILPVAPCRGK